MKKSKYKVVQVWNDHREKARGECKSQTDQECQVHQSAENQELHTYLAFSLCTKVFLSTDAFLKFWKPHWSEANSKPRPSLHTLYDKDLGSTVSGFSSQMQSWTVIQKIAEPLVMMYSKKASFFLVWQSFKWYRGRSKETLFRKHTLPVKCRSRTVQRKGKKNPSQRSFQHCV